MDIISEYSQGYKLFMEQNLVYDSTIIMKLAMRLRVCDQ